MPSIEIFNLILINNKGENDNIIEKKPGRQHQNQVTKFNIASNEKLHHVLPAMMHWERHNHSYNILAKKKNA